MGFDASAQYKLGNIAHIQTGPFGSQLHKKDYKSFGTPIITVEHIGDNRIIHEKTPFVSEKDKERLKKYIMKQGDIVFSRVGSVDRSAYVHKAEDGWLFSGRCLRIRVTNKDIEPLFLSYYFKQQGFKEHIRNIAVGATMPSLNTKILKDIKIDVPPLREQKRIVMILSSIDDKIESNNQINKSLEEMAQAIFKRWFVDFEFPNENGDPYKSSGGEFEESELGLIPQGWKVKQLGEIIELAYGKALKKADRVEGSVPVYGSNGQVGLHNKRLVKGPGIVVGRKGNPGTVNFVNGEFFPIDTAFYVLPKENSLSMHFLYYLLDHQNLASLSADSAVPGLNRKIAYRNLVMIPSEESLGKFNGFIKDIFQLIADNTAQNNTLSKIRDTLLPKLMSGEIRVPMDEQGVDETQEDEVAASQQ